MKAKIKGQSEELADRPFRHPVLKSNTKISFFIADGVKFLADHNSIFQIGLVNEDRFTAQIAHRRALIRGHARLPPGPSGHG